MTLMKRSGQEISFRSFHADGRAKGARRRGVQGRALTEHFNFDQLGVGDRGLVRKEGSLQGHGLATNRGDRVNDMEVNREQVPAQGATLEVFTDQETDR
jgi:hypothetical protein